MSMFKRGTLLRSQRMAADRRRDDAAAAARGPAAAGELIPERISLERGVEILRKHERKRLDALRSCNGAAIDGDTYTQMWIDAQYFRLIAEAIERVTKKPRSTEAP